jgi:hypothetical protein
MNQKLSGSAMRTVLFIARKWELDDRELRAMLGGATPRTLDGWREAALGRKPLRLPAEIMPRIAVIVQLHIKMGDDREWLDRRHPELGKHTPMAHILAHPDGLGRVRAVFVGDAMPDPMRRVRLAVPQ